MCNYGCMYKTHSEACMHVCISVHEYFCLCMFVDLCRSIQTSEEGCRHPHFFANFFRGLQSFMSFRKLCHFCVTFYQITCASRIYIHRRRKVWRYVFLYACVRFSSCLCVFVCLYVCGMYVIYVHMHVCMYIYLSIDVCTFSQRFAHL